MFRISKFGSGLPDVGRATATRPAVMHYKTLSARFPEKQAVAERAPAYIAPVSAGKPLDYKPLSDEFPAKFYFRPKSPEPIKNR
jgi:hypothetical protein